MLNKIVLMGRLVRDPELRRTGGDTAVAALTLAVDRDYKSQSGEKETDFIDVVAWRSTAEFVSKYFTKGRMAAKKRLPLRKLRPKRRTGTPERRRKNAAATAAAVAAAPRWWRIACTLETASGRCPIRTRRLPESSRSCRKRRKGNCRFDGT